MEFSASRLPSRSALTRLSVIFSALLPAILFLYGGYQRRWAGDDGFINLRVVRQLLDGNGFVFNAGERSEAVTSAAWVLVLWLLGELGCEIETAACYAALLLSFVGLLLAGLASAQLAERTETEPTLAIPVGVLAFCAIPVAWDYETSALENGLGFAFLGGAYWLMVRVSKGSLAGTKQLASVAAFIGLAPLVRPDFALYAMPLLALLVAAHPTWKGRALVSLCAALPGGSYQIFRMGYFASLVPNTAIAKEAFSARWDQGMRYFENTWGAYQLLLPVVVVLLVFIFTLSRLVRQKDWRLALLPTSLALAGALHIVYVVRVGGDFMHGRMLLPGLFALFASGGTLRVRFRAPELAAAVGTLVVVAAWAGHCARALRPEMFVDQILDEHRWWSESAGEAHPTRLGDYVRHQFYVGPSWVKAKIAEGCPAGLASLGDNIGDHCKRVAWPDSLDGLLSDQGERVLLPLEARSVAPQVVAVYGFRPIGISGNMMGLRINLVDAYGLADPLAARTELVDRGRPGHEKAFSTVWFAAKYVAEGATQDPRVSVAKRALGCGLLKELHEATHDPLTVERFVRNIGLSFELHQLRVPTDPNLAFERFCRHAT